jgi:hypothetical protein
LGRILGRVILWILLGAAGVYALDWAVWQTRVLTGSGYRSMTVDRFVVAPLKGGREEYYPDGKAEVRCSVSLFPEGFPQPGSSPCWWVAGHPVVFDR